MPALPTVPHVIRIAVQHTLGMDTDVLSIFHVQAGNAGPYTPGDLQTLSGDVGTVYVAQPMADLSHDLVLKAVIAKDLSVVDGAEGITTWNTAGAVVQAALPAATSLVASWKEGISYRGGHPRTYIPGLPVNSQADDQHMTTAFASAQATNYHNFMTGVNALAVLGGVTLGVVHYRLNKVVLTPPEFNAIQAVTVSTQFASQRRRNGR